MILMFISDIHGSSFYAKKAIELFEEEKADYLVILGDILYHGARNPLPKEYAPKEVIEVLNHYADRIIAIRGNCDSEVDQMVLEFPLMSTYSSILCEGRRLFLTHGHIYNQDNLPPLQKGDAFIQGHTHIPVAEQVDGIHFINPGSITMPKENHPNTYGVMEDGTFTVKTLDGKIYMEMDLA